MMIAEFGFTFADNKKYCNNLLILLWWLEVRKWYFFHKVLQKVLQY